MIRFAYFLLFYILISFTFQSQAQYETRQAIDFYNSTKIARGELKTMLTEDNIEGSPYLNDEFTRKSDDYFIRVGKEPAVLISRKKDLEEVFPDHQKEIRSFIKKNKVKPNKPERMAELVQYYNSL